MTDNKELVERVARVIWEHSGNGCSVPDEEQTAKAAIDVMQNHFPDVGKMVEQQTLMDEMAEALECALHTITTKQGLICSDLHWQDRLPRYEQGEAQLVEFHNFDEKELRKIKQALTKYSKMKGGGVMELTDYETPHGSVIAFVNDEGKYVCGEDDGLYSYLVEQGIKPEAIGGNSICSIGFSEKNQKWYGWSHRAINGFGVGSEVKFGDCAYNAPDEETFAKQQLQFWGDEDYHAEATVAILPRGVEVGYKYNDKVPNEKLRGTISSQYTEFPKKWGRGEWVAKTLEDAKQMAVDFAEAVA